jgi:hypothetical protein
MNRILLPALIAGLLAVCLAWWIIASGPPGPKRVGVDPRSIVDSLPEISSAEFVTSAASPAGRTGFRELDAADTGLDLVHVWDPPAFHRNLVNPIFGTGVAIGDCDGDGWQDVFVARQTDAGRLYRNLGGMKFEDVTRQAGIDPDGMWATGATFADVNNDGWLDLYLCGHDCPNRLYINEGGRFTEQAARYGLDFRGASVVMTFADYDRDGDLDGYLVTNFTRPRQPVNPKVIHRDGLPPQVAPENREDIFLIRHPDGHYIRSRAGQFDHFYRNDNGKFVEVTEQSGIGWQPYMGHSASWWDYNDDGWPDLYVANDYKGPDFLYRNNGPGEDGQVTFTNVIEEAMPHTPWYSMGSDFADVNNDGRLDYMASDMAGTTHYRDKLSMGNMSGPDSDAWFLNVPQPPQYMRNALFLNTGTPHFMELAFLAGLAKTDWTWAVKFADFDNDGWQDVFCTNGMTRDLFNSDARDELKRIRETHVRSGSDKPLADVIHEFWAAKEPYRLENLAFRNTGDLKFSNVGHQWGLDHLGVSTGAAVGDLDNDGDLDLVVTGFEEPVRLYQNDLPPAASIRFRLLGTRSNHHAVGARVEVQMADGQRQVRYASTTRGFMSTSEPVLHFGVGDRTQVARVTVRWPAGHEQVFEELATNRIYTIVEKNVTGDPAAGSDRLTSQPLFRPDLSLAAFAHREFRFDDFQRQPLLPNQYSQLGPGMAWGDIDGDGDHDLYLGGAAYAAGQLVENRGGGLFVARDCEAIAGHASCEDMGALFFDADGDGDQDLYVVSGGVECDPGAELLQDRLYLNDGTGAFQLADHLPDLRFSGSCVNACDFDRDGRLDLFVGGRIIPGSWPETPRSALLRNTADGFQDVTNSCASGLAEAGLVTGAIWSDVDQDDWIDLLVTVEWGPVRLFRNHAGQLVEETGSAGLAERVGWYNSITGGDIDNDGDTDFVVGNFGLNSKYKASPELPAVIYYGDFEGLGRKRIVEAKYENGVCLPRRGLSCSSHAMPMVREKLPTFHEFATADLFDIYTGEKIDEAAKYEANSLESGVLINDSSNGQVRFRFRKLPTMAQASPIFGCQLIDVNGDGFLDLYVVQNFYGPQRESGYLDGGVSLLMLGDGSGSFRPLAPSDSGLVVTRDATSLTATDINGDQRVDFVVGKNDQPVEVFLGETLLPAGVTDLTRLANGRQLAGARILVELPDGSVRLHEVFAGDGYLSQSPLQIFGQLRIRETVWPTPVPAAVRQQP